MGLVLALASLAVMAALAALGASDGPPALLVLRIACRAPDPAAVLYDAQREARAAGHRVLGFEETCGAAWSASVTRAALSALSAGAALGLAGAAGAAACGALTAAAVVLGVAVPAPCWRDALLAAAATQLASALRWRSVVLAAPQGAGCTALLELTAHSLAGAGLAVRHLTPQNAAPVTLAEVVILCVSYERGVDGAAAARGAQRALLLHAEEEGPGGGGDLGALIDHQLPTGALLLLRESEGVGAGAGVRMALRDALADAERSAAGTRVGAERVFGVVRAQERAGAVPGAAWRAAATLGVTGERALTPHASRRFHVRVNNLTAGAVARWAVGAASPRESLQLGELMLGGAVLVVLSGTTLAALALARRRGRRGSDRGAPVLSAADFTFPVDERRVGDGIETMLSCWLRRLHEFSGPEPLTPEEPAAALSRVAELAPPRAPSLPSSTCSVNRVAVDRRTRYKGDPVHVKYLQVDGGAELKRSALDVLLLVQGLRHENLNPFLGWLEAPGAMVWAHCWRGSLEDVLREDDIRLDWTFRLSLLTDLVKGMRYLHASPLRVHGRLTSRACLVDSRWVLRVSDYGLPALCHAQPGAAPPPIAAGELLWTAPELLRDVAARTRGSQAGDVFSFAIVMQEVIVRGEPYCMLSLSPEELVEKLARPPPLIRPSVSIGAAPPEAVSVMRQCWSEAPDHRPDFQRLHDTFRRLHRGRKINIVDSMFEMLEKYSNNLEELIKERTELLDMEKKKTEQLLNRMLPRAVAERLLLGGRVEPEEFACVSIYFSDIVGFTALAARSSPVQVVDLLNDLYSTFDAAIERYRVYKVETIGDAYMVVGGLPARAADHAEQVATMALHLLHLAGGFRVRHLPATPLHLRIGLHSGPVCAGVVGLTMPRYCLFGDTVNTASRMESTGAAWRVQVSATTAAQLAAAGGYRLQPRGAVLIKGKGKMHTHWLLGKEGFDKELPTPPPLRSEELLLEAEAEGECEPPPALPAQPAYRRQWSLERGESLAVAAAAAATLEPLALARAAAPARYRTRELRPPRRAPSDAV